jgi:hypothetical protein
VPRSRRRQSFGPRHRRRSVAAEVVYGLRRPVVIDRQTFEGGGAGACNGRATCSCICSEHGPASATRARRASSVLRTTKTVTRPSRDGTRARLQLPHAFATVRRADQVHVTVTPQRKRIAPDRAAPRTYAVSYSLRLGPEGKWPNLGVAVRWSGRPTTIIRVRIQACCQSATAIPRLR